MTIDEAIQDYDDILDLKKPLKDKDYKPALWLGREALKRIKLGRTGVQRFAHTLLPGETEK